MIKESDADLLKLCGHEELMSSSDATEYRSITMRAAYLAQDRPDVQFSVKTLAEEMHKPTNW